MTMTTESTESAEFNPNTVPDDVRLRFVYAVTPIIEGLDDDHVPAFAAMMRALAGVVEETHNKRQRATVARIDKALEGMNVDPGQWPSEEQGRTAMMIMLASAIAQAFRAEFDVEHPLHGRIDRPAAAKWFWKILSEMWGEDLVAHSEAHRILAHNELLLDAVAQ